MMRWLSAPRLLTAAMLMLMIVLAPAQAGWGVRAPSETIRIFFPAVARSPGVSIQFGSGLDGQNNLVGTGTVFAYGIARLYYRYTIGGAAGRFYRTEWLLDGVRQPLLDDSGPIPLAQAVFTNSFCSPSLGSCAQPVPRGTYHVALFIDDLRYQEATAVVQ